MIKDAYRRLTLNPRTGLWQHAQWIPNWAGKPGNYAVRFPGQRGEVDPQKVELQTKNG